MGPTDVLKELEGGAVGAGADILVALAEAEVDSDVTEGKIVDAEGCMAEAGDCAGGVGAFPTAEANEGTPEDRAAAERAGSHGSVSEGESVEPSAEEEGRRVGTG